MILQGHSQHSQHVRVPILWPFVQLKSHEFVDCNTFPVGSASTSWEAWPDISVTEIAMIKPPFLTTASLYQEKHGLKQWITLKKPMRWDSDNSPPFEENPQFGDFQKAPFSRGIIPKCAVPHQSQKLRNASQGETSANGHGSMNNWMVKNYI